MKLRTLIWRSLAYHLRANLGVVAGAAVGSAALIGALIVGDSVRESLRHLALARLGNIQLAMNAGDRFVRQELAKQLAPAKETVAVPVVILPGTATSEGQTARANNVQVIGVNEAFGSLAKQAAAPWPVQTDSVVLNQALADQLHVQKAGEIVILRLKKPSQLSREATIATKSDAEIAWRVTVQKIIGEDDLGNFGLRANQVPPQNAFVNLQGLLALAQMTDRANLILLGSPADVPSPEAANQQLAQHWQLADADLQLRELTNQTAIELHTPRIFLDPPVVKAAQAAGKPQVALTYLVNLMTAGENSTPYSMVAAVEAPLVPTDMKDDEILISQWLADDLNIKPGATMSLTYFLADSGTRLVERTNEFKVRAIVPPEPPYHDRTLMPEFPGIAKAESTHDWDAGFPLVHKIRPKDDAYWKEQRGTPKAFITLHAGQALWGNRYGDATSLRFAIPNGKKPAEYRQEIEQQILAHLKPGELGLQFQPVKAQALAAAQNSEDFGELFIGFSFFLILAALILMALLFRFGMEQRATEAGTLMALGYAPKLVRRLYLWEGVGLAVLGGIIGSLGGMAYARAMLHGLTTIWRNAVGTSALHYYATPATLVSGLLASVIIAVISIWLVLYKFTRQPTRELLAGLLPESKTKRRSWGLIIGALAALAALGTVGAAMAEHDTANAEIFFSAGSLLLIAGLAFASWGLVKVLKSTPQGAGVAVDVALSLDRLGLRGCARRHGRSLATMGLLACGSFLVASIGVFRLDADKDAHKRSSGTGGFALIGESAMPVLRDLNTAEGRDFYSLGASQMADVSVVPMRVREGDDASCLNLNRAQTPRVLGVNPAALAKRRAFTFAQIATGGHIDDGWRLLTRDCSGPLIGVGDDEVPAVADAASIQWALHKKVGDTIDYRDERGRAFKLRLVASLANSVLQGSLLIDEAEFLKRFPNEAGHRMFLIDAPAKRTEEVAASLTRALRNTGFQATSAAKRLDQFNAVQNTYLNTFQILGGLGLLLGSAGLGIVVLRNILERRNELALLLAVGFQRRRVMRLILVEHGLLLAAGLGIGLVAAAVAVLPALLSSGSALPYRSLALTLGLVLANGFAWTWMAAAVSLRGNILAGLRSE